MSIEDVKWFALEVAPPMSLFWVLVMVIFRLLGRCEKWKSDSEDSEPIER